MEQKIGLFLLGIVAVMATAGLLLHTKTESGSGALTLAEKYGYGAEPWTTVGSGCGLPSGCISRDGRCAPGYHMLYSDGRESSCLTPRQATGLPYCSRTPVRWGSHSCSTAEPNYAGRCVCPGTSD